MTDTIKDEEYQAKERNIGKGHQCLAVENQNPCDIPLNPGELNRTKNSGEIYNPYINGRKKLKIRDFLQLDSTEEFSIKRLGSVGEISLIYPIYKYTIY